MCQREHQALDQDAFHEQPVRMQVPSLGLDDAPRCAIWDCTGVPTAGPDLCWAHEWLRRLGKLQMTEASKRDPSPRPLISFPGVSPKDLPE